MTGDSQALLAFQTQARGEGGGVQGIDTYSKTTRRWPSRVLVMINFVHPLGLATVHSYLDKHDSGCFCERVFGGLWAKEDCPPWRGWASPNQLMTWAEQKTDVPWARRSSASRRATGFNSTPALPSVSNLPAHPLDVGLASFYNHRNRFLKLLSFTLSTQSWPVNNTGVWDAEPCWKCMYNFWLP